MKGMKGSHFNYSVFIIVMIINTIVGKYYILLYVFINITKIYGIIIIIVKHK